MRLYKTYVRPTLEYGYLAALLRYELDKNKLEKVRNKFYCRLELDAKKVLSVVVRKINDFHLCVCVCVRVSCVCVCVSCLKLKMWL